LSAIAWFVLSQREKRSLADCDAGEKTEKKVIWQSYGIGVLSGSINKVANFLLVLALVHVDASVQYPMVTGGTMIVSTALSFFGDKKPNKGEILGVLLAFLGMLALFLIPA
jgi:drug/metabolite transporter (DMT)-like permease